MVEIDAMLINENLNPALQDRRHPYLDFLEPQATPDEIRDARLTAICLISAFASGIANSLADPRASLRTVTVTFWSRALALGLPCCSGLSVTDLAASLGVTRATLSKAMVEFTVAHGLPPSPWMKGEASRAAYAKARVDYISNNGAKNGEAKPMPVPPARSV